MRLLKDRIKQARRDVKIAEEHLEMAKTDHYCAEDELEAMKIRLERLLKRRRRS
jgi:hypothetical protein